MQHLHSSGAQVGGSAGHHFIEPLRAERSTEDKQGDPIRVESEVRACGSPLPCAVECDDRRPHGHAHVRRAGDRAGDSFGDPRCEASAELVGHACARVGLMDDDRHSRGARGEVGRDGDISTEAHDDIGLLLREDAAHLTHGAGHARGDEEQVLGGLARHGHGGQRAQSPTALGHEPGLEADRAADEHDLRRGIDAHESVRQGQRGLNMPRRSSGSEEHLHESTRDRP